MSKKMMCPKCKSHNIQIMTDNVSGKTKTSLNLNPLKPFTVFNTKQEQKVRSKSKTIAAIFTGGVSLLFTGGTKSKVKYEVFCTECGHRWYKK